MTDFERFAHAAMEGIGSFRMPWSPKMPRSSIRNDDNFATKIQDANKLLELSNTSSTRNGMASAKYKGYNFAIPTDRPPTAEFIDWVYGQLPDIFAATVKHIQHELPKLYPGNAVAKNLEKEMAIDVVFVMGAVDQRPEVAIVSVDLPGMEFEGNSAEVRVLRKPNGSAEINVKYPNYT